MQETSGPISVLPTVSHEGTGSRRLSMVFENVLLS